MAGTVRDGLRGLSYKEQFDFGVSVMDSLGIPWY
jgi:hypothetical protein